LRHRRAPPAPAPICRSAPARARAIPSQNWCLFVDKDGDEVGWVRGSYLIGSGAKNQVTPSRLFDDDWGLFPRNRPFFEHDRYNGYDD
jgi:hypothetical protein